MYKKKSITKAKRAVFLDVLRTTGNVSASARAVNVSPRAFQVLKNSDADFAEEWDLAKEESLDTLEAALRHRAIEGIEKPVYYAGKKCGTQRSYSDTLGMYISKSHRSDGAPSLKDKHTEKEDNAQKISACELLIEKLDGMAQNLEKKSKQHYQIQHYKKMRRGNDCG